MLLKFLGLADLTSALALLLSSVLPPTLVMVMALYLLAKGGIFVLGGDKWSLVDVSIAGYMMVIAAFGVSSTVITAVAVLLMLQKGGMSLLA